ncbi:LLM class flavin-dependent oxidoreductase [Variovorax sp. PAMC26660]|uniref:LLM class flavin-dependent oxidoreductase n=1 Tax=Variovorax sp. PAMC26660 TaxID=2762322 RepID=UPI00164D7620|nr:LLM class flavin-dependent oxidoreductase [Variovorax sp. PAMC26660]QNK66975.1 LLM class flavin-dependent oxidoreductase [Variovorax sp. PAMC26660]
MTIRHLGFLTPGNYAEADPLAGLEAALKLFEFGEKRGFDGAWVRQRHLERGVSSASTFLAAATQRTQRIELGAAVIQMGYENPFRLAEDLATVDVLSRGRLQVGLSAGAPLHGALLGNRFYDAAPNTIDFTHKRVGRLRANLEDSLLGDEDTFVESAGGRLRPRVQPHAPGLVDRLWYGGGSLRSVEWAGRNGFNLLLGNVLSGETTSDFLQAQSGLIERYRASEDVQRKGRVALGRVIVPLDSADAATRRRYRAFAAGRVERTLAPQGERRTLFATDLVGTSDEILERLRKDPVLPQVSELRVELPYNFSGEEYEQILHDLAQRIAPALGWHAPGAAAAVLEETLEAG